MRRSLKVYIILMTTSVHAENALLSHHDQQQIENFLQLNDKGYEALKDFRINSKEQKSFEDFLSNSDLTVYDNFKDIPNNPFNRKSRDHLSIETSKHLTAEDILIIDIFSPTERRHIKPTSYIVKHDENCKGFGYSFGTNSSKLCKSKTIITLPKPDVHQIATIFCESPIDSGTSSNGNICGKFLEETDIINEIIDDFRELKIESYFQKYKVGDKYFQIKETNSSVISSKEKDIPSMLFINTISNSNLKLSQTVSDCLSVSQTIDEAHIGKCKYTKIKNHQLLSQINIQVENHSAQEIEKNWKCTKEPETFFSSTDNKTLDAVFDVHCYSAESHEYAFMNVNALTGKIQGEIDLVPANGFLEDQIFKQETLKFDNNNQSKKIKTKNVCQSTNCLQLEESATWLIDPKGSKTKSNLTFLPCNPKLHLGSGAKCDLSHSDEKEVNAYIHADRLLRLISASIAPQNINLLPQKKITINFDDSCKRNGITFGASAYGISGELCLRAKATSHTSLDATVITHELAHIMIPQIYSYGMKSYQPNLRVLFHDLADTIAHAYTNQNCIGKLFNSEYKCTENLNDNRLLPREINNTDALNMLQGNMENEYQRGQVVARMFQIAFDVTKSNSENTITARIKHWIRLTRTLLISNISTKRCGSDCENQFRAALQTLKQAYLFQLNNSNDYQISDKLKVAWMKEGF